MWNFMCDIDNMLVKSVVNGVQVVHVDSGCDIDEMRGVQVVLISF